MRTHWTTYIIYAIGIIIVYEIIRYIYFNSPIIENYESYTSCIDLGYPMDFCLNVPIQSYISGYDDKTQKVKMY